MAAFYHLAEPMSQLGEVVEFLPGQKIAGQGQPGSYFFFIKSGTVELVSDITEKIHVKYLSPGDCFGEISCLTGEPYPTSAVAVNKVVLYRANRDVLIQLTGKFADFNRHIIESLCQRVKRAAEKPGRDLYTGDGELYHPTGSLICLSPAMRAIKDRAEFHKESGRHLLLLGEKGVGKKFLARYIHGSSSAIEIEATETAELHRVLHSAAGTAVIIFRLDLLSFNQAFELADRLKEINAKSNPPRFIFTSRQLNAGVNLIRNALSSKLTVIEVPALRQRIEDIPALAKMFLKHYALKHNLRITSFSTGAVNKLCRYSYPGGNVKQLAKVVERAVILARDVVIGEEEIIFQARTTATTEKPKVGLALGSGAVRGMAHIGAAKVLKKHNIPIDMIAGTSAGALMGACLAAGVEPEKLERIVENMSWSRISKPLFPKSAFLSNSKLGQFLERIIGKKEFCELDIPFVAVATDAHTGEEVVLKRGKVSEAVKASAAIPVLFEPVELFGRKLIDGAVVNMVPASVCRSMGADIVIAVSVTDFSFETGPPKNIYMSVLHYMDMLVKKQVVEVENRWADILVKVDKPGLSAYSFKDTRQLIKEGELAAEKAIPRIKELITAWQK
ncbi:putative acylesterase/phospholipase RssA/CRP-like cAMP-binding protein [Desulfohalotomaculum tongense]|uniref:patatin-like phospholipase family protein n=1 Tax=Desulforadius tongensis TaxID=1216062 RepID=UPI00195C7D44|nr:patatin-like phospholipase family protein [Desulforadius tongensis]MBM7853962.1 putative acylesterase/phospholipase RssA/CRP-like cAMP-binding protein [Desulforadius tongensis]